MTLVQREQGDLPVRTWYTIYIVSICTCISSRVNVYVVNMSDLFGILWCLGTSSGLVASPTKTTVGIKAASGAVIVDPIIPPGTHLGSGLSLQAFAHRTGRVVLSCCAAKQRP